MRARRAAGDRRPWALRVRLTAAFATVIALVLAACALLIYLQFARYIDGRTDEELRERSVTFQSLAISELRPQRIIAVAGEEFAQIYDRSGRLAASSRALNGLRLLTPAQLAAARSAPIVRDRLTTSPTDAGVRLRAFTIDDGAVAVIGESRNDRERELDQLALLLLISMPGALLLASLTGYQVAGAALRPVERMRSHAARIGDTDLDERLGEPGTGDELDRLAQTLNDLLERLHGALDRERRIVGDASHELRTPIAVLRTRLDVASRGEQSVPALQAAIYQAQADAARLTQLADDLLVLARADQGQLPLRREPIEVQELLERAVARHGSATASIAAVVTIDGGAVILADPGRVDQILDNLLVNALRHGAAPITVTAQASDQAGFVAFVVADAGGGFPPELGGRAFERFSQGDAARSLGGSGLGLAIVDALSRAHGGSTSVAAAAGGGAAVTVRLPAA